ncbi:MAG: phage terminase large subunit [Tannerella sp.]|nr:phage terminase large subunit [Tannerella sp.]
MVRLNQIYSPLFENKEKFIILVTGGRGSGKSFAVGTFIQDLTFETGHTVLYCRYTMTSAGISIIPELLEKIELNGTGKYFETAKTDIINRFSGSRILFRGIKTSSGNQTAKLKSIQGLTTFVCDEAEEWVSETDYEKILFSIRQKGIQNRVIIIMNPSSVNHFIYKKYIEKTHRTVNIDGVDVQISTHPNVLHIHTSYLDNLEYLGDEFLREAEQVRQEDADKYAHLFIGRWANVAEGVIFKKIEVVEEIPDWVKKRGYGMDFGFSSDPTAIIDCGLFDSDLYLDEVCYKTRMLTGDIISELKKKPRKTVSESADPRLIQEIANAGILIYPVSKGPESVLAGIRKMLDLNIKVTKRSHNLLYEFRNYTWDKDKDGNYIDRPADKYNHGVDASRYWVYGELLGRVQNAKRIDKEDVYVDIF